MHSPPLLPRVRAKIAGFATACLLVAGTLRAEDGYRLWLRYDKIDDAPYLQKADALASEIVLPGNSPTLVAARAELKRGLSGLLDHEITTATTNDRDGAVIVGTPASNPLVGALPKTGDLDAVGDEGYQIRTVPVGGKTATVIVAPTDVGVLHGVFHFLRLLQTRQDVSRLNVSERPALQRRMLDHWDNLNGSIERGYAGKSLWDWNALPGTVDPRYVDYARANASLGLNGAVLNNVNAKPEQLDADHLKKAAALADVFRPYGIHVYLSANFAAPKILGGLPTADPADPAVQAWWNAKADEIYALIPDFGGFLVKANSEGQPGPQDYHLSHADGANLLADAVARHRGIVMWRAFVYNGHNDPDRAKRAFVEFKPLDGQFRDNVFVQVKNGPIDFQPREAFHPLFGAMPKTLLMAELEVTQENMGHSTDIVYLAPMWKEFLDADTYARGPGSTVAKVLDSYGHTGIAGVANVGRDRNWCGHDFAQANWYAYGRLAWNPDVSADAIAADWTRMTWGNDRQTVQTITTMLRGSWQACVNYEMPLGLHHIMEGGGHYKPAPQTTSANTPEYSATYYHKADAQGIGFERTAAGTNAVSEYAPAVRDRFASLDTCPLDLLLWFHHVPWDYKTKTGRTVWEELCFRYNDGVDDVRKMQTQWDSLQGKVDAQRFAAVQGKLKEQLAHAISWRDTCLQYFQSVNKQPLPATAH